MNAQQQPLFETEPAPWELDDLTDQRIATVVLPEVPFGPFDYLVPEGLRANLTPGQRVRVPLGRGNRFVTGYCMGLRNQKVGGRPLKLIKSLVDQSALLSPAMLRLTEWMSEYYLCQLGQVLEAVVPAGVRGQAGTREQAFLSVPTSVSARLTQLKLPPKQALALRILAASPQPLAPSQLAKLAHCTAAPINELRKKKLVMSETRRIRNTDVDELPIAREAAHNLNPDQQQTLDAICESINAGKHKTLLVHGITGSGKTEVYIRAIDEVIQHGRQAIVLVPEISLTPQTRRRFRSRFDHVAVLHSHLSAVERHFHWQRIASGEVQVVVGARSAIFAPTPQLGLVVIDEEHDSSFKQDTLPRYHAREVALCRARMEEVPVVLGSATPSLDSWQRASDGEFQLLQMPSRVEARSLPDVVTVDQRVELENPRTRGAISRPLFVAMNQALKEDGQIILLLNRRGFSTNIQCPACGHVVCCPNCDISLTHHREGERTVCHYCDFESTAPVKCPECHFEGIRYGGLGTQKLEAEVHARFSGVSCLRMDSDTMQKHGSHEKALSLFRAGDAKILLGTQMIAKGLDFPNVTLVGVINADTALHFPDFRAAERTFQLVTQVAGRTGRGEKGGRVLVQTFSPDHPAIMAAAKHDYAAFAETELPNRQTHGYPPFAKMARLIVRGPQESTAEQFTEYVVERLRCLATAGRSGIEVIGPAPAPIAKLRGKFRFHLLVRAENRDILRDLVKEATQSLKPPNEVQWAVDMDPIDLL